MSHARARTFTRRALLLTGVLLASIAGPASRAQDAMTFPRNVLTWYLQGDTDRVWDRAGPMLREMAERPETLAAAAAEILGALGAETAVLSEQLFDHPEGGGAQVYVRASRHSQAPEMFWIVIFWPSEAQVLTIMPQPRQTIRTLFPQVTLP
jgi:hypothetical protein